MVQLKKDLDTIKEKYQDQVVIVEGTTKNYVMVIALISLMVSILQAGGNFLFGAAKEYATKEWVSSKVVQNPASQDDVDRKIGTNSPWLKDKAMVIHRIRNLEAWHKESLKDIMEELKEIRQIISENHPRRQANAQPP